MKKLRKGLGLLLALLMLLGAVGCGQSDSETSSEDTSESTETEQTSTGEEQKEYKFGFAVKNETNPFFISIADGIRDAAEEIGATVNVQATEQESDIELQRQILDTFLTQDYDAIFVTPLSSTAIVPFIKECNDAGVPIIVVDTAADAEELEKLGAEPDYFIACDNEDAGKKAAECLMEALGGQGNIAILEGTAGALSGVQILEGIHSVLDGTDIVIQASQPADWNRNKGYDVTSNIIAANPDLDAILASNDEMGLGAINALRDNNLLEDILVVSINNTPDGRAAVKAGDMYSTVDKAAYEQGLRAVEVAVQLLNGETLTTTSELLPATAIMAEDITD